jgi:hypothetical protein
MIKMELHLHAWEDFLQNKNFQYKILRSLENFAKRSSWLHQHCNRFRLKQRKYKFFSLKIQNSNTKNTTVYVFTFNIWQSVVFLLENLEKE